MGDKQLIIIPFIFKFFSINTFTTRSVLTGKVTSLGLYLVFSFNEQTEERFKKKDQKIER